MKLETIWDFGFFKVFFPAGLALMLTLLLLSIFDGGTHIVKGQTGQLYPNMWAYTAVTTAQQLIGTNPTRHGLQICNPGGTNTLWIAPQGNAINTGAAVTPAANGAGTVAVPVVTAGVVSCWSPPAGMVSIGQAWNGFSTTTPVTVYEW